jgi:dTDP-glucose pyrophosphorylase
MDKTLLQKIIISPDKNLKHCIEKMNETGHKILFVAEEGGRLIGTLTDGDIRRALMSGVQFTDVCALVMHKEYIALQHTTPMIVEKCKQIMIEKIIEYIPILDDKGVIIDVLRWCDVFGESHGIKSTKMFGNRIVVMAGGKGTRLGPFTKIFPKPLIPVGNKPVIELIMDKFHACGFSNFTFTLNYKKEYIIAYLKENSFPYRCDWIEEPDFLGTAGSLSLLRDKIHETFFVTNCDTILDIDFAEVLQWHKERHAAVTIIGCYNEVKIPFGVLETSNTLLQKMNEKPVHGFIINTGVYLMEPHILSYIPRDTAFDMNHLLDAIVQKEIISVFTLYSGWYDVGQLEEYRNVINRLNISQ